MFAGVRHNQAGAGRPPQPQQPLPEFPAGVRPAVQVLDGRELAGDNARVPVGPGVRAEARGAGANEDGRRLQVRVRHESAQEVRLRPLLPLLRQLRLLLLIPDAQLVRGRHHGQLRLLDEGRVDSGRPSFGRVYSSVVRNRSGWNVSFLLGWQPEVALNYSCPFFLSIYNLFININYFRKAI